MTAIGYGGSGLYVDIQLGVSDVSEDGKWFTI